MNNASFPPLNPATMGSTRDALHAYARLLGDCLKRCRSKRKHWWHASLRSSLNGLTTGVVYGACAFELELNLRESLLGGRTDSGARFSEKLEGQAASVLASRIGAFLMENGVERELAESSDPQQTSDAVYPDYSAHQAAAMGRVLGSVSAALVRFRAGVAEECSPIQVWPHHFDLSMLWLPGEKVPGENPDDEEVADKQMNFGFTFGDDGIPEPYFYVTAYPLPEDLPGITLPDGSTWRTQGFNGAFLPYAGLSGVGEPSEYLLSLWSTLLAAGRDRMKA